MFPCGLSPGLVDQATGECFKTCLQGQTLLMSINRTDLLCQTDFCHLTLSETSHMEESLLTLVASACAALTFTGYACLTDFTEG